jgi:prepilin-type N-terminal cleavage/methylation domain-containing protein
MKTICVANLAINRNPDRQDGKMKKHAFTLVELLTVIAIIGILAAILIPVIGAIRKRVNATIAMSNIRQLLVAQLMYANEHKDMFTPTYGNSPDGINATWHWRLLPYLYPITENSSFGFDGERQKYITTLRANRNYIMDVPETLPDRFNPDGTDSHKKGIGINPFISTGAALYQEGRSRLSDVERPNTIIMLGEMDAHNGDCILNYLASVKPFRRSGDKACMGMCDGQVKLLGETELAITSGADGSPWRWKW